MVCVCVCVYLCWEAPRFNFWDVGVCGVQFVQVHSADPIIEHVPHLPGQVIVPVL